MSPEADSMLDILRRICDRGWEFSVSRGDMCYSDIFLHIDNNVEILRKQLEGKNGT